MAIPVDYIQKQLSLSPAEWSKLTEELGLIYQDNKKTLLDCKESMKALPLVVKPGSA